MNQKALDHLIKRAHWLHESAGRIRNDLMALGISPTSEIGVASGDAFQSTFELVEKLERAAAAYALETGKECAA